MKCLKALRIDMTSIHEPEEHLDILQNIKFAIVSVYRGNPEITDHNVDMALETLVRMYRGRKVFPPQSPLTLEVYEAAQGMCDWRLGEVGMMDETRRSPGVLELHRSVFGLNSISAQCH